jgi:hypothetical protein
MTTTMQERIKDLLEKSGLPFHEIKCYGQQITVECIGRESCEKWAALLGKFATVRGMVQSIAYAKDQSKRTTFGPKTFPIWRVYAAVK